uniref:ATP synthase F0 subunit 6 n=1 Tax=Pitambara triremiprocta TaxID=3081123 RepID=UPI002A7F0453|nr:ATP synthase F0 subunit 6 [Pitambara triremiprocta]WOW99117.1 ATP synthase F0 subunit 6 [Pitambara triremiprocta]
MMTSLFMSFDPSTQFMQLNWMMMMSTIMILPLNFWMKKSRWNLIKKLMEKKIISEFNNLTHHKEILILSTSMFMLILTNNILGLFPYNFTATSQIALNISLALPTWLMLMIYGWMKFYNFMFIHLLPLGTPKPIMPMMIMIETLGNIIRPISLSVRLTANMIAGHLLMTLLGNMNSINIIMLIFPLQIMLTLFESAISMIQAYVFATLMTLYSSEIP